MHLMKKKCIKNKTIHTPTHTQINKKQTKKYTRIQCKTLTTSIYIQRNGKRSKRMKNKRRTEKNLYKINQIIYGDIQMYLFVV